MWYFPETLRLADEGLIGGLGPRAYAFMEAFKPLKVTTPGPRLPSALSDEVDVVLLVPVDPSATSPSD